MVWPSTEPANSWSSLLKASPCTPWNHEPGTRNCWLYSFGAADCASAPPSIESAATANTSSADLNNRPNPMHLLRPLVAARTLDCPARLGYRRRFVTAPPYRLT